MKALTLTNKSVTRKALLEMANKSKGGMFVGMAIASVVGGIVSFVATKIIR